VDTPKLPDGPNPAGAAGVRALSAGGGAYQTKQGAGYTAKLKGGHARVTGVDDTDVVVAGTYGAEGAYTSFAMTDFRAAATRISPQLALFGLRCDTGTRFIPSTDPFTVNDVIFVGPTVSTENTNDTAATIQDDVSGREDTWGIALYFAKDPGRAVYHVGEIFGYRAFPLSPSEAIFTPYEPRAAYAGRVLRGGLPDTLVLLADLAPGDRTVWDRTLLDLHIYRAYMYDGVYSSKLTLPDGNFPREYLRPMIEASDKHTYVVLLEWFFYDYSHAYSGDVRPGIWVLHSPDLGDSWSRVNIRSALESVLPPLRQRLGRKVTVSSEDGPVEGYFATEWLNLPASGELGPPTDLHSPIREFFTDDGRFQEKVFGVLSLYAKRAAFQIESYAATALCNDGWLLMSFTFQRADEDDYATMDSWVTRIVRIKGSLAEVTHSTSVPHYTEGPDIVRQIIHVGAGVVIAKKVSDGAVPGSTSYESWENPITMLRSMDNGASWQTFVPAGLDAPLVAQNFGLIAIDKAVTDKSTGRILMTGWNAAKQAYYIYSSTNLGDTWKRGGRVAKPDTFKPIGAPIGNSPGADYDFIRMYNRPVDPALPDRYVRKVTP
jgi:hypothetical protein